MSTITSELQPGFISPDADTDIKSGIRVQIFHESDITPEAIGRWEDLERHAVSSTPYLSRAFVETATAARLGQHEPIYLVIEQNGCWVGLGVFESVAATRSLPVPHLRSWRTNHTYLDSLLIRLGSEQAALNAFWDFMKKGHHPWYAVEFRQLARDDRTVELLESSAGEREIESFRGPVHFRAAVELSAHSSRCANGISRRRARSLRQGWNWLCRQGEVSFNIQKKQEKMRASALRFLELEAMGWKSKSGTALNSHAREREFFLDLVDRLAQQDRVFFLELSIDKTVIASVVHFVAGEVSFAFKLGWDPQLSRGCPGFQLKAQTLFQIHQMLPHLKLIDSCACPGSFIEHVWADRREIAPQIFITSRIASFACSMLGGIRWIRDRGCHFFHHLRGQHDENC